MIFIYQMKRKRKKKKKDEETLKYIGGGKLGDFIHCLYIVMVKYEITGKKGDIYITDDCRCGGDKFGYPVNRTYQELYDIVISQPYVASFNLYTGEIERKETQMTFDVNLNDFRRFPMLFSYSWLESLSKSFHLPLLEKPWITFNDTWIDPKYEDLIVIHRSKTPQHQSSNFIPLLESIVKNNKCIFVTCEQEEYSMFALKHLVPLDLKTSLKEIFITINSCRFFIGNQSSPLAIALSLFKPLLCDAPCER